MQKSKNAGGRARRFPARLIAGAAALVALAIPATAAAHPAVYEVERKTEAGPSCTAAIDPTGACFGPAEGPTRYVVANHGYPYAFNETNGLDASDGGVINFTRLPSAFRKTITTPAGWFEAVPSRTGVQPHATCVMPSTSDPATIAAWQGTEPFYAYIPWQSTSVGIDDVPADWIPVVKDATGVDLTGMDATAAKAACEGKSGVYYPGDEKLASIATGLVADEVAKEIQKAVTPLEGQITTLTGEKTAMQGQIDAWVAKGGSLEGQVTTLSTEMASMQGTLARVQSANAKIKQASKKKTQTIKKLRKQLRQARQNG